MRHAPGVTRPDAGTLPWLRLRASRCLAVLPGLLLGILFALSGQPREAASATAADDSALCDRAARAAARRHGVPLDVLRAISRTETGRVRHARLAPWPWTVNMEGTGRWFDSRDEARDFALRHFRRGARSFDVGCFQINFKWHGAAFSSIDDMFDPMRNAAYAAAFLKRLHSELGSWPAAAGAYHSRNRQYAESYVERFEAIRSGLESESPAPTWPLVRTGIGFETGAAGPRLTKSPVGAPALLGSLVAAAAAPGAVTAIIALERREGLNAEPGN